jgi:uracil-DNA glycosylase
MQEPEPATGGEPSRMSEAPRTGTITPPADGLAAARAGRGLADVAELAGGCRGCDLWARGTQTVFGEGTIAARVMLVGEQPGDQEDLAGSPFVGPAGRMLDRALVEAGIDRERVFVTNVVKHFKWRPSGKWRLHERPTRAEIRACRPWLEAELELVQPKALVLLGATAAQALLGPSFRLTRQRGTPVPSMLADLVVATFHPSAILRAREPDDRERTYAQLVGDLRAVERMLSGNA